MQERGRSVEGCQLFTTLSMILLLSVSQVLVVVVAVVSAKVAGGLCAASEEHASLTATSLPTLPAKLHRIITSKVDTNIIVIIILVNWLSLSFYPTLLSKSC